MLMTQLSDFDRAVVDLAGMRVPAEAFFDFKKAEY